MSALAALAPLLFERAHLGLAVDASGIGVSDGADSVVVDAADADALALLRRFARRTDRVFSFLDAKPQLRALLRRDIDVARPVCLATLTALGGQEWPPSTTTSTSTAAAQAASTLSAALALAEAAGQRKVARLECLVLRPFAALEHRGLPIHVATWRALVDEEKKNAAAARARLFELAGDHVPRDLFGTPELNLDAEAEVRGLFLRVLGRPLESVDRFALERLEHPLASALLAYREAQKVVSTYGAAFLDNVRDVDVDGVGRIRSNFVPLGASTGRVACRDPNLQNLPKDARFHQALRAPAGRKLVTADYGTCELRIVAELAEDPVFVAAFDRGDDLHSTVATSMFGVPVSKTVNAELRQRAKAINFGLVYGMGPAALSASLGVDRATGEELLARYFRTFPRVRDYLEGSVDVALRRGYSETVLGRRLTFDKDTLASPTARGDLARIMKNMPIQGTSADMTKLAMVRVHERLVDERRDAGLVNTVHDELVVECSAGDADAVAAIVVDEMSEAHRTLLRRVPPAVEVHVGDHWAH